MGETGHIARRALPGKWFAAAIGGAAAFCAFVLPFLGAPPARQVYSAAYVAGSNNKLATVTLALLAVLTAVYTWRRRGQAAEPENGAKLGWRVQTAGAGLVLVWTATLGAMIAHAQVRFGEAGYFSERIRDMAAFSPRLYSQMEWPYGPLLLLPPVWLHRALGLSVEAGYWTWLTVLNVAGIALAGYVLNRLPLTRVARLVLFALCCFEQMHPLMGPNYSLGKFLLPAAVLLWGTSIRGAWKQAAALAAGHLLTILLSPELGVGLAAGLGAWAGLTAWRQRSFAPLASWLAPVFGYGVFLVMYGRGFIDRLSNASAGALNLVIEPLPDTFVLLLALVWLAPIAVGLAMRRQSPQGPVLAGFFVLSLGLLPGALGRADPLHVFFNGLGILLLSAVGIERLGRTRGLLWLAALVLLGLQTQAASFSIYLPGLRDLVHATPQPADFDTASLSSTSHGEQIAAPALLYLPLADELALRRAGLLPLDYEAGLADLWDARGERAKIARLRGFDYALMPNGDYIQSEGSPNESRLKRLFRGGYLYPQVREPYRVGALLQQELAANWVVAERFKDTSLLKRVR